MILEEVKREIDEEIRKIFFAGEDSGPISYKKIPLEDFDREYLTKLVQVLLSRIPGNEIIDEIIERGRQC
ncbi:hypothetical protein LCGC14_0947030 [marine sediment metagenome]|uniref:Uncharacterized protein n=1 Tax=marine sediment metagenome TaxID=412755 RepID=A0A0F9NN64_9ZZZZ